MYLPGLTSAFTQAILPVFAVAGAGYVLGRLRGTPARPVSTVTIYVLVPALVFDSLVEASIGGVTGGKVVLAAVVMTVVMWGAGEVVARFFSGSGETRDGLVLSAAFPNTANYGIPLSVFAFPGVGRATAVLYVVGSSVMIYTAGVYIAARGDGSPHSSLRRVFELPLIYAIAAAVLVNVSGTRLPSSVMEPIGLLGDSAVPVMLLVLGLQLAHTKPVAGLRRVGAASLLRLLVAPVLAVPVVLLIGFSDPEVARVVVLESGMPVAVTTILLTLEFRGDADYVSTSVLVTTLASVVTLTVLIPVLKSGVVI